MSWGCLAWRRTAETFVKHDRLPLYFAKSQVWPLFVERKNDIIIVAFSLGYCAMKEESRCCKKRAANIFERLGLEAQEVKERLKMKTMMVRSYVELTVPAGERHLKVAREAAEGLTTDKSAVSVEVPPDEPNTVVTTFPMARARQNDVADRIMHAFAMDMEDYSTQSVGFPKSEAEQRRDQRKLERAKERRRERRAAREAGGI